MKRRTLVIAVGATTAVAAVAIGWEVRRAAEADALVEDARARLAAPLSEAPELDRIQAAGAVSLLERAEGLGRTDLEARGMRHVAEAIVALARGDLIFAEGEVTAARHAIGWTPDLHVIAGEIARRRTDVEGAQRHVDEALAAAPDHVRALVLRADLAIDRGDGAAALADVERLVQLEGDAAVVRNRYGLALELTGALDAAERELREAARLSAASPDPWINLGRIERRRGDHESARDAFDEALRIAPTNPDAHLGRGLARVATGMIEDGQQDFRRAAELAPNDAEPLLALGDLLRDVGRVDDAIDVYRLALDREDGDAASWLKLGNALVMAGQPDLAATSFQEAIARAPGLAPAHNGLGAALMYAGELDRAETALARAAELDVRDPNPLMNLGLLAERRGDPDAARDAWGRALERDPDSEIVRERLAAL